MFTSSPPPLVPSVSQTVSVCGVTSLEIKVTLAGAGGAVISLVRCPQIGVTAVTGRRGAVSLACGEFKPDPPDTINPIIND